MPKSNDVTQEPFVNYQLEGEKKKTSGKTFTVWMSDEEYADLERDMDFLEEPKPSTALKQLAKIGSNTSTLKDTMTEPKPIIYYGNFY